MGVARPLIRLRWPIREPALPPYGRSAVNAIGAGPAGRSLIAPEEGKIMSIIITRLRRFVVVLAGLGVTLAALATAASASTVSGDLQALQTGNATC
jgi:hypothetical protein